MSERKKVTVRQLLDMKKSKKKIVAISLYDYPTAFFADKAGVDVILVGDGSVGMTALGYSSTVPVTINEMMIACKAVVRGARHSLILADMPFMSYHASIEDALRNAGRFMKETGVDAVKLEGGLEVCNRIKAITSAGIPVVGHIGLTPQTAVLSGGYKVQGRTAEAAQKILKDAVAIEENGAFAVVVEFAAAEVAEMISKRLSIPTLGWGSGLYCDGIGLNISDILGMSLGLTPKFAKQYSNLNESMSNALNNYRNEVQQGRFPEDAHSVHMEKAEYERLLKIEKARVSP